MQRPRDRQLDIVKALGIILVVAGHSGMPFKEFISLFHMAIFFMASGYVYRSVDTAEELLAFV